MKNFRYILSVLIVIFIFLVSYDITYRWSESDKDNFIQSDIPEIVVNSNDDIIISNITQLTMEIYNADDGSVLEIPQNMPVEYIGLTREKLIGKLQDYMLNQAATEKAKGLLAYELVAFSKDSVTLRKTYSQKYLPKSYIIRENNNRLYIYLEDGHTFYDETDIYMDTLPESIKSQVSKGLRINSIEALYDFLETFTS